MTANKREFREETMLTHSEYANLRWCAHKLSTSKMAAWRYALKLLVKHINDNPDLYDTDEDPEF